MPSGRRSLEPLEQELKMKVGTHYFSAIDRIELLPRQLPVGCGHRVAADG